MFPGNTEPTFLKNYEQGEAFGELALLYNAPRAASITTTSDESVLYALDRMTFNFIVKGAAVRKRERHDAFMKKVSLFDHMDDYEKS